MLSSNLEKTLRNAYQLAADSKHEFVTLEHLLKSLTDDKDALSVLKACGVEIEELKNNLEDFIKNDLSNLKDNFSGEPKLTNSFQRVLQRAAIHVQSSGRESVTGANMIVALFSEKESHAVYFLHQQNMTRLDAVQYISHERCIVPHPTLSYFVDVKNKLHDSLFLKKEQQSYWRQLHFLCH